MIFWYNVDMKNKKQLKAGEMVQICDSQPCGVLETQFSGHGKVGYLVQCCRDSGKKTTDGWVTCPGSIWEVICFGDDPPMKYKVHESWLNLIDKSADIKKV